MNTITFTSLANVTTDRATVRPSATETTRAFSLAELVSACLDGAQLATRASLEVDPCPPSGRGSDRETVRVGA